MARDYEKHPQNWTSFELGEVAKSLEQETADFVAQRRSEWFQHLEALDNLLTLFGLERHEHVFGGGFLIYHRDAPNVTRWISGMATEESWLEDVKLLAK
jgi:hypothetical protein